MRSWAVPKGPSLDPAAKRLAVQVEDHGLDHNNFEAPPAPAGVIVWDRGLLRAGRPGRLARSVERGHAVFVLHGQRAGRRFVLQRTGKPGIKSQWLLSSAATSTRGQARTSWPNSPRQL